MKGHLLRPCVAAMRRRRGGRGRWRGDIGGHAAVGDRANSTSASPGRRRRRNASRTSRKGGPTPCPGVLTCRPSLGARPCAGTFTQCASRRRRRGAARSANAGAVVRGDEAVAINLCKRRGSERRAPGRQARARCQGARRARRRAASRRSGGHSAPKQWPPAHERRRLEPPPGSQARALMGALRALRAADGGSRQIVSATRPRRAGFSVPTGRGEVISTRSC